MTNNVVSINCFQIEFLTKVRDFLLQLKKMGKDYSARSRILQTLEALTLKKLDFLPEYFCGLYSSINTMIFANENNIDLSDDIDDALLLCDLLQERPSVEWFKKIVSEHLAILHLFYDLPENIIYEVIESLKNPHNVLERIDQSTDNNYSEHELSLIWLGLSQMCNLSENTMLDIIKFAKIEADSYVTFCQNIADSSYGNEKLLLALIERVESEKFYTGKEINPKDKVAIYVSILEIAVPTENVVAKIVEVINIELYGKDIYYQFFYEIIQDYVKGNKTTMKKIILNAIIKKINFDEPRVSNDIKLAIRKIRLLATNI